MAITLQDITQAVDKLKTYLPQDFTPQIGIIGGSGLSALHEAVQEPRIEVSYADIKGFPVSTGMRVSHVERNASWILYVFV